MKYPSLLVLASLLILPACTPLGLATSAATGAGKAVAEEGGISGAATDARIQIEINDLWFKSNVDMFGKLDMTVKQGRVLITGIVQNPEHRVEAVRLAWQPKGVKQVINEIRVAKSEGITGYAKDAWIATSLRTKMTFDKEIRSINYTIDTVGGTIYLMGIAQSQLELNRVVQLGRTIKGVKGVVSYVKLAGAQDEDMPAGGTQQGGDPQFKGNSYTEGQGYSSNPNGGNTSNSAPIQISPQPDTQSQPAYDSNTYNSGGSGTQKQGIESEVLQ
jgi:osmotically-inducible protein OsmY